MDQELKKQFKNLDQRFDGVDRRFERLDQRFDKTDRRLTAVETRLGSFDTRLTAVEVRLDRVDGRLDSVDKRLDAVTANMFTKAEAEEMRAGLADKSDINRLLNATDVIAKGMHGYNQELPAIKHQLQNINDWIRAAAKKIGVEYHP